VRQVDLVALVDSVVLRLRPLLQAAVVVVLLRAAVDRPHRRRPPMSRLAALGLTEASPRTRTALALEQLLLPLRTLKTKCKLA
jgi:hypothetical protein